MRGRGRMEAEFRFGLRDLSRYRIGDQLRWDGNGVKTPETRPEGGNYNDEAYVVCPHCERDFWLSICPKITYPIENMIILS